MFGWRKKEKEKPMEKALAEKESSPNFAMGVQDVFHLRDTQDLVVVGWVRGTVHTGDAVYVSHPGADNDKILLTTIVAMEINVGMSAAEASDCNVGLRIENGSLYEIRKGAVLYSRECPAKDVHDAYVQALTETFVVRQKLELSEAELDMLTITDCAEIWRLFSVFMSSVMKNQSEEEKQENVRKRDRLAAALSRKILEAEAIYCLFNKATNEPHLFSRTVDRGDGTYMCTPPDIRICTKAYEGVVGSTFPKETFELRRIENGEKRDGIYNFLGSTFYLNGACGVEVLSEQTSIAAGMLVPAPDYSNTEPRNIPVTNPELMRWMLLLGQMGKPQGGDSEIVYKLYYRFWSQEIGKARFLIPMQKEGDIPNPDEAGKTVLPKGSSIRFRAMESKGDRSAVSMFTDWKRLRMVCDESWDGMVMSVREIIDVYDCAVNPTQYPQAGCYVSKEMFEEISGAGQC